MSYHVSNLGSRASRNLVADIDGYVHTTVAEVLGGRWDAQTEMDEDYAAEVAATNVRATAESEKAIEEWQRGDAPVDEDGDDQW